ncbi:MAG: dienelactone hydrolase family protein [Betaproteobacteria bacterium]
MTGISQIEIDQQVFDLYDEYCHGRIDRREFLKRAGGLGAGALAIAYGLMPNYARAQTISFTDPRIKAQYVSFPSPGGNADTIRGYLVVPAGQGPWPALIVIHENRGLNPYVEDVARRAAVEGFIALAPDGLSPLGGYPGNDDDGRAMWTRLDQAKMRMDMLNGAWWVKKLPISSKKLGALGFCWGGTVTNFIAVAMGADLQAAVPFYGSPPAAGEGAKIRAPLLAHLAENDPRVNEPYPAFEEELKKAGVRYQIHLYPGTQHGFHNSSTPRHVEAAAKLAWERTVAHFKKHLA